MGYSGMWASRRAGACGVWRPGAWLAMTMAALSCPAVYAQPGSSSAPWAGSETYTVHATGSLDEVLAAVRAATGASITKGFSQPPVPGTIAIDLADVSLRDILLDVCGQAGLVYDVAPGAKRVVLRPGDVAADPRPMVDVGDYIILVDEVVNQGRKAVALRWGRPEAARSEQCELRLRLSVIPAAGELLELLAGISAAATAVTDSGEALATAAAAQDGGLSILDRQTANIATTRSATMVLPTPEEPATVLSSLEGALLRYSEVTTTEIALRPDDVGKTVERDDVTAELMAWSVANGSLTVAVRLRYLPLGASTGAADSALATLVLKDGTVRNDPGSTLRGAPTDAGSEVTWRYQFGSGAPPEVDHLKLTVARRGPADQVVPFRIEGIPLP